MQVLLLILACNAAGSVIRVPEDHTSIQTAIQAAVDGDTVSVAPGTYAESLDFLGKAIVVTSRTGPEDTILHPSSGNGVMFRSGESLATVLEGFTIQYGGGVSYRNSTYGGGIFCLNSSPTIRGNVVRQCGASYGGGIACVGTSAPSISSNEIRGNNGGWGGGVAFGGSSAARFVGNRVALNYGKFGAGIACVDAAAPLIESNVIEENLVLNIGGRGGGVFCHQDATPAFVENQIIANRADSPECAAGAAFIYLSARPTFTSNRFALNRSTDGGPPVEVVYAPGFRAYDNVFDGTGFGLSIEDGSHDAILVGNRFLGQGLYLLNNDGARVERCEFAQHGSTFPIMCFFSSFSMDRCTFSETRSPPVIRGPCTVSVTNSVFRDTEFEGFRCSECVVAIANCTIVGNGGGPLWAIDATVTIVNSILWDNTTSEVRSDNSTVEITHSVVDGGYPGEGNLDTDPRLVDPGSGEYHLRIGSPCIDAGSADVPEETPEDIDGDFRLLGDAIDIGADEFRGDIALRFGYVDDKARTVLRINGTHGDHERVVQLSPDDPVSIEMMPSPAGPNPARFALYAWLDQPDATTFTRQPFHLGWTVFPTPLQGPGANRPALIWNNLGRNGRLGVPDRNSTPAPSVIASVPNGIGLDVDLTLQGFIGDDGSRAVGSVSITNAVVLRVVE